MELKKNSFKFIDLFAGCGGMSLGLEEAGFSPVYVNELNHDALETYLINREQDFPYLRDKKFHSNDILNCFDKDNYFESLKKNLRKIHGSSKIDLICGGPPCQGYSRMGIRRNYAVEKKFIPSNHLYKYMAKFIEIMNPSIFLFENVEGLLKSRWTNSGVRGEIWKDVYKTFEGIAKYDVKFSLLKSKDYGIPQNRPRVILVGIKKNLTKKSNLNIDAVEAGFLPEGNENYPHIEELLSDLDDPNYPLGGSTNVYSGDPENIWQTELRTKKDGSLLMKGDELTDQEYSNHSPKTEERLKAIMKNKGVVPKKFQNKKFSIKWLPKKWGNNGPNITVTSAPDDFIHFSRPRSLTVRECARLQTFPDWYKFMGKRTTGGLRRAGNPQKKIFERELPKYTQIGNAVPVKLARQIGFHFKEILEDA